MTTKQLLKYYEVGKYLKRSDKKRRFRNWKLQVGGLTIFFDTIKEADNYYQKYLK